MTGNNRLPSPATYDGQLVWALAYAHPTAVPLRFGYWTHPSARCAMSENRDCDVVIVGAGVAGAILAWKLGSMGVKVIVLESGPGHQGPDARDRYIDNFKVSGTPIRCAPPRSRTTTSSRTARTTTSRSRRRGPSRVPMGARADAEDPRIRSASTTSSAPPSSKKGDWFQTNYERQAGGATWHWLGNAIRLLPTDFKLRSTYDPRPPDGSRAYDWPIAYDDLEPWYGKAEETIGVAGNGRDHGSVAEHSLPDAAHPAELFRSADASPALSRRAKFTTAGPMPTIR